MTQLWHPNITGVTVEVTGKEAVAAHVRSGWRKTPPKKTKRATNPPPAEPATEPTEGTDTK